LACVCAHNVTRKSQQKHTAATAAAAAGDGGGGTLSRSRLYAVISVTLLGYNHYTALFGFKLILKYAYELP